MATHSSAYIPTNRKTGEYVMSEGWSNGMLGDTGFSWYESVPRMDEAIRATMMLGGSPVFAPAGKTTFEIKEIDFIAEDIEDELDADDEEFINGVTITLEALEKGDFDTAQSTVYAQMSLEEKMAKGITLNTSLHTLEKYTDVPSYGEPYNEYNLNALVESVKEYNPKRPYDPKQKHYIAYSSTEYFYDSLGAQWWGAVMLQDDTWMWVPLVIAFALEQDDTFKAVKKIHAQYPEHYKKDMTDLAAFEAALHAARHK